MTTVRDRVVVVVMTGLDAYQTPLLDGMCQVLHARGYSVVAHISCERGPVLESSLTCAIRHLHPAGVITTNSLSDQHELALNAMLHELVLPAVRIGQDLPGEICVRADNGQGMTALMRHLLDDRGARRPVLVRGLRHHPDHVQREAIFRAELARRDLPMDEDLVIDGESERDITHRRMRALLARRRDMDAVVTTDDWCALAAIDVLKEAGLRVPEDVAVTGFDNYPLSSLVWPGLTTVDQNLQEQGRTAAELLLERLAGHPVAAQSLTPCTVVVRGTTAPPGASSPGESMTGEIVAQAAQAHLASQAAVLRLSRAMIDSRTLDDLREALVSCLEPLGLVRCFLAVYEGDPVRNADGTWHHTSRLVLDYRRGTAHPVPEDTYSSCDLLPPHLRGELAQGFLGFQMLVVGDNVLGHLLADHPFGPVPVVEPLRLDLSRTLQAVFNTRRLEEHSAELEELVAQRTSQLEDEVRTRRHAELELTRINLELERSLARDGLTRIANRTALERHLEKQWAIHVADGGELALLMVDVDVFKAYNDRYGHLLGDDALRAVASCLERAATRSEDLACRFGGEEFVVVLPRAGVQAALTVARRFRAALSAEAIPHDASPVADVVTASVGIAVTHPSPGTTPDMLVAAADRALYRAKEQGRDRIAVGTLDGGLSLVTGWRLHG